ncbi:EmrB/QacA subfamily drug resistance transporter [Thermosporothrix hazakensis]|uniref:EmrB/QacA subfamily drug resistance transporter n=1 Tax=Thermosporothrix hazakensis TaxID=644383 RepID=A0A326U9R5_THEHA|nr:MFS transporter [Thermosporothrix hazakensis]PZW32562.1 EmrB/QacA subfamily drug resistance transporter [Thermosporothrix hazakensis]GCE49915.1 MFS transporter [Thermosporothrix hazakensis]
MQQTTGEKTVSRGWILFGAALATLMSSLDTSIVNIALPTIITDLHASFAQAQWVVLSYMLVVTSLIVGIGRLSDLFGKKRLYLIGLALFSLTSLFCGLSPTADWLIAMRALQGLGAAVLMALSFAIVSDAYHGMKAGHALGILTAMVAFGIALGPTLGGLLLSAFSWHAIFIINVPFGLLACGVIWVFLPGKTFQEQTWRFDWPGMIVLALTLGCYAFAMTEAEELGFTSPLVLGLLGGAVSGVLLFLWLERRVMSPLLPLQIFRNATLSISLLVSVLVYTVMMGVILIMPFFLSEGESYSSVLTGLLMSTGALITALLSTPVGLLANRFGARPIMAIGVALMVVGCLFMSTITIKAGIAGFTFRLAIINIGLALFQTPNNTAMMESALPSQRGLISGLLSLARTLGLTTGASFMGTIYASMVAIAAQTGVTHPQAVEAGTHGSFLVASALIGIAFLLTLLVLRIQRKPVINKQDTALSQPTSTGKLSLDEQHTSI